LPDFSADSASNRTAGAIFSVALLNIFLGNMEGFFRHYLSSLEVTAPQRPMLIRLRYTHQALSNLKEIQETEFIAFNIK
jgi:hypothetical protein